MKTLEKIIVYAISFTLGFGVSLQVKAEMTTSCHGQSIFQTIENIKLSDFFPITIGSATVESGNLPDTDNPENPVCECGDFPDIHAGAALGYWEPMALIDVTRTPYCMPGLNGTQLVSDPESEGDVETQSPDQNGGFYYVHYINFPVIRWLFEDLLGGSCIADGDFNIPYFSEIDPLWKNENLANLVFPDAAGIAQEFQSHPLAAVGANASCGVEGTKVGSGAVARVRRRCHAALVGRAAPQLVDRRPRHGIVR